MNGWTTVVVTAICTLFIILGVLSVFFYEEIWNIRNKHIPLPKWLNALAKISGIAAIMFGAFGIYIVIF